MKNITKLLSILIIGMGVAYTDLASATFMPTDKNNIDLTIYDPIGSRQCFYEIYCNRATGKVGIDPKHIIIEDLGSAIAPGAWSGYRFGARD